MLVAMADRIVDVVTVTEPKPKFIMQDMRPPVKLVETEPPRPRQVDDDWFVLLDVAAKESGILLFYMWLLSQGGNRHKIVSVIYFTLLSVDLIGLGFFLIKKDLCVSCVSVSGPAYPYAS